ncbi:hypothetical protein [Marinobacterium litorale]|uniref:hypothetical protein n=1 Tax=Marinobacterium litorale TaxID=404770 RepID=UPI0004011F54|nr:hypothetical protein [Marinobacterium litorale]
MDKTFKRHARRLLVKTGEPCDFERYHPQETITSVLVRIDRDVEVVSAGETETTEYRNEAEMLVDDVGDLKKRDRIHTETSEWYVESKISNDGYTVKAVVTEL